MKYGTDVDNAIREAFAGGLRFSDAYRKLKAGTLDGIGPVPMPERTFVHKWRMAKREQQRAGADSERPWPRYWNVIRMFIALDSAGVDTSKLDELDPEEVAGMLDWPVRYVRALIARQEAWSANERPPTGPPPDETEREREIDEEVADWHPSRRARS